MANRNIGGRLFMGVSARKGTIICCNNQKFRFVFAEYVQVCVLMSKLAVEKRTFREWTFGET